MTFPVGTRLVVDRRRICKPKDRESFRDTATVIRDFSDVGESLQGNAAKYPILVHTDHINPDHMNHAALITEPGMSLPGHLFSVSPGEILGGCDNFQDLPPGIGLVVEHDFTHDDVRFPSGAIGVPVGASSAVYCVSWIHGLGNKEKSSLRREDGQYRWNVPKNNLRWCVYDPKTFVVKKFWPNVIPGPDPAELPLGQLLLYKGKAFHCAPQGGGRELKGAVRSGTVLEFQGPYGSDALVVSLVGGCRLELLGTQVRVRRQDVVLFKDLFFRRNEGVEICAEIEFKKRNLQGLRGTVLLPPDEDGDVGVQFQEEIGAGSLDGLGRQGYCLYVSKRSLKKVSE